jgi:hypothetical protein
MEGRTSAQLPRITHRDPSGDLQANVFHNATACTYDSDPAEPSTATVPTRGPKLLTSTALRGTSSGKGFAIVRDCPYSAAAAITRSAPLLYGANEFLADFNQETFFTLASQD